MCIDKRVLELLTNDEAIIHRMTASAVVIKSNHGWSAINAQFLCSFVQRSN